MDTVLTGCVLGPYNEGHSMRQPSLVMAKSSRPSAEAWTKYLWQENQNPFPAAGEQQDY